MSDIAPRVVKIIAQYLNTDEDKIKLENKFVEDLGADSLDIVELITQLEMDFGIKIPDEDAEGLVTVGDAVKYIEEHATQA